MGNISAFTTFYDHIEKRLVNEASVFYNGEHMDISHALWDTGANISCISQTVIDRLELKPIGEAVEKYIVDTGR